MYDRYLHDLGLGAGGQEGVGRPGFGLPGDGNGTDPGGPRRTASLCGLADTANAVPSKERMSVFRSIMPKEWTASKEPIVLWN